MMRIKEAIQRKKLIHEMNEEWRDIELEQPTNSQQNTNSPSPICDRGDSQSDENETSETRLQNFVIYLSGKLTDLQKRALKITWRRLSEAPKTSGRGTLHIMEKVLNNLCEQSPGVRSIFYKSAFLSCIEDRKNGKIKKTSIATVRDHAHILIDLIDQILHTMFEGPVEKVKYDPIMIVEAHKKLCPLGFDRSIWHVFGECFAEVMFNQECIRAYPHAPSAWSLLAVALTDRLYSASRLTSMKNKIHVETPIVQRRKNGIQYRHPSTSAICHPLKNSSSEKASKSSSQQKRSLPSFAHVNGLLLSVDAATEISKFGHINCQPNYQKQCIHDSFDNIRGLDWEDNYNVLEEEETDNDDAEDLDDISNSEDELYVSDQCPYKLSSQKIHRKLPSLEMVEAQSPRRTLSSPHRAIASSDRKFSEQAVPRRLFNRHQLPSSEPSTPPMPVTRTRSEARLLVRNNNRFGSHHQIGHVDY